MPPHHHWCKQCGSRSFTVLKELDSSVKMKCDGCGKISYKSGRYAFRLARQQAKIEAEKAKAER